MIQQSNHFFLSKIGGREENQDAALSESLENGWFIGIVCDGMGGLQGGSVAATLACNEIINYFRKLNIEQADPISAIQIAVQNANSSISEFAFQNGISRMGTTVAILVLTPDKAVVAHVGDSRIYQTRQGTKVFRTFDHSKVMDAVKNLHLTEEEARVHEESNKLTRALGTKKNVEVEISTLFYKKGDIFILCTDGVWGVKPEEDWLSELLKDTTDLSKNVEWYLSKLNDEAEKEFSGDHDNLTLMMIRTENNAKGILPMNQILLFSSVIIGILSIALYFWLTRPKQPIITNVPITSIDSSNIKRQRGQDSNKAIQRAKDSIANYQIGLERENKRLKEQVQQSKDKENKEETKKTEPPKPSNPPDKTGGKEKEQPKTYIVKKGENLKAIAETLKKDQKEILDCNPDIINPDDIKEGQVIILPPCNN